MSNKAQHFKQKWNAILDGLADHIEIAPAENLLEDARAAGKDPAETAAEIKNILLEAATGFEQRKLNAARRVHEERVRSMSTRSYSLPANAEERRAVLFGLFAGNPEMGAVLTTQHRNFKEMTDEEVASALKELAELGLLEEGPSNKNE